MNNKNDSKESISKDTIRERIKKDSNILYSESRDKNRIPVILDEIKKVWEERPDMRLCQLIINATGKDPYYIEDDELIRLINNIYKDKKILYSGVFWVVNNLSDLSNDDYLFKIKTKPNGEIDSNDLSYKLNAKSEMTYNHQKLWDELPSKLRNGKDFDYYPRGRVMIANNKATVYYNPNLNSEEFKNYIIDRFNLTKENGINKVRFICDCSEHYKCHLDK